MVVFPVFRFCQIRRSQCYVSYRGFYSLQILTLKFHYSKKSENLNSKILGPNLIYCPIRAEETEERSRPHWPTAGYQLSSSGHSGPTEPGTVRTWFPQCHMLVSMVYCRLLAGPGTSRQGTEGVTEIPHVEETLGIINSSSSVLGLRRLRLRKGRIPQQQWPPHLNLGFNVWHPVSCSLQQPLLGPKGQIPGTAFLMDPALPVSASL